MEIVFFLRREAEPGWPVWKTIIFYSYRVLALLLASVCLGTLLLCFAYGAYSWGVFEGYFASAQILVMNVLPVVLLVFLFYGITGRAWSAFLIGGGIAFGFSLGSYYKLTFRDDPLHFEDMFILREAKAMAGGSRYALFVDKRIAVTAVCLLLGTLVLFLLVRGRLGGWRLRVPAAMTAVLAAAAVMPAYLDEDLYGRVDNYEYLNQWSATQEYIAHGFFYPFIHSVKDSLDFPPSGYSEGKTRELLSGYEDADIPEDRKINIIALMREAYVDFSRYDIPGLDTSGYELYHQLEAESLTGNLVTNIFAGGTVDTERCFLTGSYKVRNFRSNQNSYLWYLREQGYTVEGSHPYYQWFYNRQNINSYLGFERYRYLEDDYINLCEDFTDDTLPEDALLLPEIYSDFQKNKATGKPYFSFSVNVQSHGPYAVWDTGSPERMDMSYSLACRNAMNFYLNTIFETDEELAKLMDRLRSDPDPVVLVTFGDHMPWMGDSNAFYDEIGMNIDPGEEEGFYNHYATRYLIWANDAAREIIGRDLRGDGPDISPCYLMNLVFQQLGWEGPAFMQAMEPMMETFPVVSTKGRYQVDGELVESIPEDRKDLFRQFLYMQYYWSREFIY
ncbi:MAG: LTA synthase family protein [Oscillospiraceae bacterium]|nr:LTA synthase family protein [Oscillospiraceae bacterium]